ncbi:PRC-barrel domain-containing protein [bacterium]|nr:PRC-barrel domain-containing protein [bacterium]
MPISLKQMKTKKVASLDEGRLLGSVHTVFVDEKTNQLKSIQLSQMVWGGDQRWIRVEEIKRIGVDLIYIANESAVRTGTPPGRSIDTLLGMSISSKDGKVMGTLQDIKISSRQGKVNKLRTQNNEFITVDARELVIGKDVILVQAEAKTTETASKASKTRTLRDNLVKRTSKAMKRGEKLVKRTSTVIKSGEKLVKRTTKAVKKIIEGNEADLRRKASRKSKIKKVVKKNTKKIQGVKKGAVKKSVGKSVKKAVVGKPTVRSLKKKTAKKK